MPSALGELIQEEDAMVGQRDLARHGHLPPPISPTSEMESFIQVVTPIAYPPVILLPPDRYAYV
jgi:hypothetical protein